MQHRRETNPRAFHSLEHASASWLQNRKRLAFGDLLAFGDQDGLHRTVRGAVTGISIFMDSRIISMSPSPAVVPAAT